jgi:hypothetical protein
MSFLPQDTELGAITLVEVYLYYDRPCLFSCRNEKGDLFLVLWIDQTSDSDRWLYAPFSEEVLDGTRSGDADLRSLFQNCPGNRVFDVEVFNDGRSSTLKTLNCSGLTDDLLPV